jgi:tripartite-type tricarboxylate transporter receptor subunit TctC
MIEIGLLDVNMPARTGASMDPLIKRRHFGFVAALCAMVSAFGASAPAQDWPTRPVTMVYPFGAGSAGDVLGRLFAARLSELLGQPVIFENVGGAGGMTGTSRVARAPPDGYQFLLGGAGEIAVNQALHKNPLYHSVTDFAPAALIVEQPIVLIARKDFPGSNLADFIAYAKANQAKMQYGSPGVGSVTHLACELFNSTIGVNITHVPYRGGGAALQDLIAGRIDYQCPIITIAIPQIESKSVKTLAVMSKNRSPILPNLQSAHEQGLIEFDVSAWYGFFLPKGTPASIVQKLHDAAVTTMETPSVQDRLRTIGATVVAAERRSPAYLQKFVKSEIEKWAAVIKVANIERE